MSRSHRPTSDATESDQGSCATARVGSSVEATRVFGLVHRQLQDGGRLSVPALARALGVPEGAVLHALTELRRRGWLELAADAPYFRITAEGRSAWRP